ncbi:MAG: zf-HC2 domain-containing protein [Candidatus Acidiferrum sp.]
MDHTEVVRLQAVEKYMLGELSPELRDQFEEHYFDCPTCAADVTALHTFMATSRTILKEEAVTQLAPRERQTERQGWFHWLRPAVALPAMAALAAVIVFQAVVTIPGLKQRAASQSVAQVYESSFRVQGATRGEGSSKVTVSPNQSFALDFDFTPQQSFRSYKGMLIDPSGNTILTFGVPGSAANKELHLAVPGDKIHPGNYELVFIGENENPNSDQKANEVQRLSFSVEFRPE